MVTNQSIFLLINSYAGQNSFLDMLAILLGEYMPFLFIAVEVYLYYILKKKDEALYAFYSVLLGLCINQVIGIFYFHNRPFMDGIGKVISYHLEDNSFPSDHTTFMLSIAFSLFFSKNDKKLGLVLIVIGIIGASFRVFIGVHYPLDIIGGIVVGVVSAILIYKVQHKVLPLNRYIIKLFK